MRNLPGIVGRLSGRQLVAAIVAVLSLAVIVLAVTVHSTLPGFLPGGSTGSLRAGNGVTVDEPPPPVPLAGPVDVGAPAGSPVANVGSTPATTPPRPDGASPPRSTQPTTTTTAPPPSTTTSTTLPGLIPGIPIGGVGLGGI